MANDRSVEEELNELAREHWPDPNDAREWVRTFLDRREWSLAEMHKQIIRVSDGSALAMGIERPTVPRIERFLGGRQQSVPRWAYWLQLADRHADIPWPDNIAWREANVPGFRDEDESGFYLASDEEQLLVSYRALSAEGQMAIRTLAALGDDKLRSLITIMAEASRPKS